jgi:hypothetical protein
MRCTSIDGQELFSGRKQFFAVFAPDNFPFLAIATILRRTARGEAP